MATARRPPPEPRSPEPAEQPPDLRIRSMTEADLPKVLEIENESFTAPWSPESFRTLLGRRDTTLLVAEEKGEGAPGAEGAAGGATPAIVAYAVFWSVLEQGELANLAVRSDRRGRGVGAALLDRVLELARLRDIRTVYLEVRASNEGARALYRTRDFEELGRREDYYKNPKEDALVLRKELE